MDYAELKKQVPEGYELICEECGSDYVQFIPFRQGRMEPPGVQVEPDEPAHWKCVECKGDFVTLRRKDG